MMQEEVPMAFPAREVIGEFHCRPTKQGRSNYRYPGRTDVTEAGTREVDQKFSFAHDVDSYSYGRDPGRVPTIRAEVLARRLIGAAILQIGLILMPLLIRQGGLLVLCANLRKRSFQSAKGSRPA